MNKVKMIFTQTIMISSVMLFAFGIMALKERIFHGTQTIEWPWYMPLAVVFTGFVCALPTFLVTSLDGISRRELRLRILLHFLLLGGIVSLCGYLLGWYATPKGWAEVLVIYVLIYAFVWLATIWLAKSDEKKINRAIRDIQDRE
ncbi:Protein of unknown function [Lachnospiraceae bacterium NK3A20]|jgi:uncharacterized membrane protein YfcA|nr:Protein of unknown function [Lachnospiraceae bacterium NK3A20]